LFRRGGRKRALSPPAGADRYGLDKHGMSMA
jgi:hypothetical protein